MTFNRHKTRQHMAGRPAGKGFTLVELLVVIFILTLLMLIAVPSVMKFRRSAKRGSSFASLQTISTGIDLYYSEMHVYPPSSHAVNATAKWGQGWQGAEILAEALTGYLDDADDRAAGDGWRLQKPGRVHGPYVDRAQVNFGSATGFGQPVFMDSFNRPFLYYRAELVDHDGNPATPMQTRFLAGNNSGGPNFVPPPGIANPPDPKDQNYAIGLNGDWYRKDYMLISIGADEKWTDYKVDSGTDDVTNIFPR